MIKSKRLDSTTLYQLQSIQHHHCHLRCCVERHVSSDGIEPDARGQFEVLTGPVHPRINGGRFGHGIASEAGIATKSGHVTSGRLTGENNGTAAQLQDGEFADRRLASGRQVRVDGDRDAIVFGTDQSAKGTKGRFGSVQSVRGRHLSVVKGEGGVVEYGVWSTRTMR
jgi:hypothetical protein